MWWKKKLIKRNNKIISRCDVAMNLIPGREDVAMVEIWFELRSRLFTAAGRFSSAVATAAIELFARFKLANWLYWGKLAGTAVNRFPLKSNVSTGVVGGTLAMIEAIVLSFKFRLAHEMVSVVILPAVGWQLHGVIDATGHLQFNSVNELNGVVSLHVAFLT